MRMKNKMKWGKITVFHIFLGPIFLYFCTQNAAQYNCTAHTRTTNIPLHTLIDAYLLSENKRVSVARSYDVCGSYDDTFFGVCNTRVLVRLCVFGTWPESVQKKYISLFRLLISVCGAAWRRRRREIRSTIQSAQRQHGARNIFFLDKPANEKCEMRQHIWLFDCSCFTRDTHSHLMHIMIMWRAKQMIRMRYACVRCAGHKRRNDRSPNTTPKTLNL